MQTTNKPDSHAKRPRGRTALLACVVVILIATFAASAQAQVSLPNGATSQTNISCDPYLTDFDVTVDYSGPGTSYVELWKYSWPSGKFSLEESWFKAGPGTSFTAAYDGQSGSGWFAMYAEYATLINGQWKFSGEYVQMYDIETQQTDYWCQF